MSNKDELDEILDNYECFLLEYNDDVSRTNLKQVAKRGILALKKKWQNEARIDEIKTAIDMTRQTFDYKSPYTNTINIDNQIIVASSSYLDNRLNQLNGDKR